MDKTIYPFYSHTRGPGAYMSNFYQSPYTIPLQELIDYLVPIVPTETIEFLNNQSACTNMVMRWSEQGFMLVKCLVFMHNDPAENTVTFNKILEAGSPSTCKKLGRAVKGYKEHEWNVVRMSAMTINLLWKFKQNPNLYDMLLATGNQLLVEASRYDRIWGVGLAINDSRIYDPKCWNGTNLLGKCLMGIRAKLKHEA